MKYKTNKAKQVKLLANLRIRQENQQQSQKRAQNALLANQVRSQQLANQYRLELQRSEAVLHATPAGLQRDAIMMNRGLLQKKYEHITL